MTVSHHELLRHPLLILRYYVIVTQPTLLQQRNTISVSATAVTQPALLQRLKPVTHPV